MRTRWTVCALPCVIPALMLICASTLRVASAAQDTPRVGLVLSGGGARGAAHIGVLKVFEREHIPVHCIAGTSFGALVGGLYALGYSADQIEEIFAQQNWEAVFSDAPDRRLSPLLEHKNARYQGQLFFRGFSLELPTGMWGGQRLIEILNALTSERMIAARYDFNNLPIPFRTVATDLVTGKAYVFRNGPMTEALRASVAIPMVFTPVEKGDMLLVDGGLVANLPIDLAREMGAGIIIAVDVTSPLLSKDEIRSFVDVIDQSLSLAMRQTVDSKIAMADVVVRPNLDGFTFRDYTRLHEIIKRGESGAERVLPQLKPLIAGIPPRVTNPAVAGAAPIISDISFQGLQHVPSRQLRGEIRTRVGKPVNAEVLRGDLSRLYATRLFDRVDSNLEHLGEDRYRLNYVLKEAPFNTLGASIRYDSDYKFVALAELTARQLFNSYSSATLSSQFGGFQDHRASLRFVPPALPFLFFEPSVHLRRRERLDVRDEIQVDQYTDRRVGGQLVVGGTFFKHLEVELGYRSDRVTIPGGTPPFALPDAQQIAGITLRLNRDTMNAQEFPTAGMDLRFQIDRRDRSLGSDLSYWKYQIDASRFVPLTTVDTVEFRVTGGYSRGDIPFYDRFYVGGYNFSDGAAWQLLGYGRDEFNMRQAGIAGVSYRRRVMNRPLGFARRAFLTAMYNVAALSSEDRSPYRFSRYHGFGLGLAVDTILGPARFTGGWGESNRFNFHLSLGPAF